MKRQFEFVTDASSKFWHVEVVAAAVISSFGKRGTTGQSAKKIYASPAKALTEANKLIVQKLKKGYVELGVKTGSVASKSAQASAAVKAKALKPKASPREQPTGINLSADPALMKLLVKLDAKLKTYAPGRHRSIRGATSFRALDALQPVGPKLRALWSWLDGGVAGEELWHTQPESQGWETMLSVEQAAAALVMLRQAAAFPPKVIPFAADGGGNFLVADSAGLVFDWDHETCKCTEYGPISALVHGALNAIRAEALFGGPEVSNADNGVAAAKPNAVAAKLLAALVKSLRPEQDLAKLVEFARRLPDAACVELLLRAEVQKIGASDRTNGWANALVDRLVKLGQWSQVATYGAGQSMVWSEYGTLAWTQKNFEAALRCFEIGSKHEIRGFDGMLECAVGAACAAVTLGAKSAAAHLAAATKAVDKARNETSKILTTARTWSPEQAKRKGYLPVHLAHLEATLPALLLLRATLATVAKDKRLAKALMSERALSSSTALTRHDRIAQIIDSTLGLL